MWILVLFFFVLAILPTWSSSLGYSLNYSIYKSKLLVKSRDLYYWLIAIPFIIISALRYPHIGTDTYVYQDIFNKIIKLDNIFDFNLEIGFVFLTKVITIFTKNFHIYLFIITTLLWYIQFIAFKKLSIDYKHSLWILFLLSYFDMSMCLIRQYFAIVILLNSFQYIGQRKFLNFLFIVLLASLFHKSALIFIISYFIYNLNIKNNIIIFLIFNTLCLLSFLLTNVIFNIISSYGGVYALYLENSDYGIQSSSKLASILNFAILYIFSLVCIFEKKIYKNKVAYHMMLMLLVATLITIPSFRLTQLSRISFYFSSFLCFLLPMYFNMKTIRMKNFYMTAIYLALVMRYCVIAFFRPEWYGLYPYKFFFE